MTARGDGMNAIEPDAHAFPGHNQEFKQQDHRNQTPNSHKFVYESQFSSLQQQVIIRFGVATALLCMTPGHANMANTSSS